MELTVSLSRSIEEDEEGEDDDTDQEDDDDGGQHKHNIGIHLVIDQPENGMNDVLAYEDPVLFFVELGDDQLDDAVEYLIELLGLFGVRRRGVFVFAHIP
jgi:hypothetical protein